MGKRPQLVGDKAAEANGAARNAKRAHRSLRDQIHALERVVARAVDGGARAKAQARLAELSKQQEVHKRAEHERKAALRSRKVLAASLLAAC
jgi:hypothetical protein